MTKKDRIAVVVSVVITILGIAMLNSGGQVPVNLGGSILIFTFIYWAYRFIKNDISFLKMKDE